MSNGNKYNRTIQDVVMAAKVTVDVYSVLVAFDVRCPARQHAIKKLLCAGLRGKGNALQDLQETRAAVERAIGLEYQRLENLAMSTESKTKATCRQCGELVDVLSGQSSKWPGRCDRCVEMLNDMQKADIHIDVLCRTKTHTNTRNGSERLIEIAAIFNCAVPPYYWVAVVLVVEQCITYSSTTWTRRLSCLMWGKKLVVWDGQG